MIPLQYQFLAKFLIIVAVTASVAISSWYVTSDHYEAIMARHDASDAAAVRGELIRQQKLAAKRAELTRIAEEQHASDQLVINRLGNQLARVRVHVPAVGCGAVPGAGQAGADTNGASGVAASRADEYLAEAQREIQAIGQRCAQLNIDAIAANKTDR